MARKWPADEIPDSSIVPSGTYTATCSIKESQSNTGKLMYKGTFSITEPDGFSGLSLWENYVIGSDQDPDADDPDTWKASIGAKNLKRCFKAASVPLTEDMDDLLEAVEGQSVVLEVGQEVDEGRKDPKYKGTVRNRIIAYYPLGERSPAVGGSKPAPKATPPAKPAPQRAPAAPAARPAPQAASKERTLKCSVCDASVPQSQFGAHVAGHEE